MKKKKIKYLKSESDDDIKYEPSKNEKAFTDSESNIHVLDESRKPDIRKNFLILFFKYLSTKTITNKHKKLKLSKFPYLFIIFKSKGDLKNGWRNIKGYMAIKNLGLFDDHYYLNNNKNILISGMNPLIHYMYYGYKEGKSPNSNFDGKYYLNKYGDVNASGMNPLVHYSLYGIKEGKKPHADEFFSLKNDLDLKKYPQKNLKLEKNGNESKKVVLRILLSLMMFFPIHYPPLDFKNSTLT